ncbi:hypothetical protein H0H87_007264 [Tephrocybe sp. NHM501043]|nr:hypothetical protein H0H87_007264 [Tephrocybe sp. NHM501043]
MFEFLAFTATFTLLTVYAALDLAAELEGDNATLRSVVYLQRQDMKLGSVDLSDYNAVLQYFKLLCVPFVSDTKKFEKILDLATEIEGQAREELHEALRLAAEEVHRILLNDKWEGEDPYIQAGDEAIERLDEGLNAMFDALRSYHGIESDLAKLMKMMKVQEAQEMSEPPPKPSKYEVVG